MLLGNYVEPRQIVLTFDVENDWNLPSFKGVEIGLPKILKLLQRYQIPATFFVTASTAEKYPKVIRELSTKYEVGCHGYYHESFQEMNSEKVTLIKSAKKVLEEICENKILGFRAPYLRVCPKLFEALKNIGFKYDSSLTWFKLSHWRLKDIITEYRLLLPNVFFRFPLGPSLLRLGNRFRKTPVLYFHPWEAIDGRNLLLLYPHYFWSLTSRPDRWFNTGSPFIRFLSEFIEYYLRHRFKFKKLQSINQP